MKKFEKIRNTVCYRVYTRGWVTDGELSNDMDAGRVWPKPLKRGYHSISTTILHLMDRFSLIDHVMSYWALSYIKIADNLMKKRLLSALKWLSPFLLLLPGALVVLAIAIIWKKINKM